MVAITVLLFFFRLYGHSLAIDYSEDDLPIFMRGIQWNKVQETLKVDLQLSASVIPEHYDIEMDVNVRGHQGANKSNFNGTVHIYLKFAKEADLLERLVMSKPVNVTQFSSNAERETITIHVNRTIQPDEKFILQIEYRGVAKMNEYGLFENWDPKINKSIDNNGPFILSSNNFPTGARFWFPCFDEPHLTATFELKVNHPSALNVYSNTDILKAETNSNGRTVTTFGKTKPISTYQLALSVNHLAIHAIDVEGFGKVQLIVSNNSNKYSISRELLTQTYNNADYLLDIPNFVKHNLESLAKIGMEIPKDKLDIIVLEGTKLQSIQPGLVTIGRYNLFFSYDRNIAHDFRNLTQIVVGNRIFVRKSEQIWLNHLFSYLLMNSTDVQAAQLVRHLARLCPNAGKALKQYVIEHIGGFADIDDFIGTLSKSCQDPAVASEFLEDFINQPGKPLLAVKRNETTVTITQTRYHSTYFDRRLRDTKTRYTVPIFFTIDGKSDVKVFHRKDDVITISVPESAIFLIDHENDHLFLTYYHDKIAEISTINQKEKVAIVSSFSAIRKSMLAAINIGYVNFTEIQEQWTYYRMKGIFTSNIEIYEKAKRIVTPRDNLTFYRDDDFDSWCECTEDRCIRSTWDGLYNNETRYWEFPADWRLAEELPCVPEWRNSTLYRRFLERNFLGDSTTIRPDLMSRLHQKTYFSDEHWRELHRFFFRNADKFTDHGFNLLAEAVLKQAEAGLYRNKEYPGSNIRHDYLHELRAFVVRNPRLAASLSTEIEMRLEREFIREELPKFYNVDLKKMADDYYRKPTEN